MRLFNIFHENGKQEYIVASFFSEIEKKYPNVESISISQKVIEIIE